MICLPLVEHTVGAQTNNYFECILIGLCHRTTHNPEVSLSLSLYSKSQGGEKMQNINLILLEQTKPKPALCFPQQRSHLKKREAWGPSCRKPGGRPVLPLTSHIVPGTERDQFLPWSNENIYGNNIPSVVARNK